MGSKLDGVALMVSQETGAETVFIVVIGGPAQGCTLHTSTPAHRPVLAKLLRSIADDIDKNATAGVPVVITRRNQGGEPS